MAFHHVALATNDMEATHSFYTEAMGFRLVKAVAAPTGATGGGWAKHLFYDTGGGGLIAFWELHDDTLPAFDPAISLGLGLPEWVNHVAFAVDTMEDLWVRCRRWQAYGIDVVELDHGFCRSIYARDPNGILVEFACTVAPLGAEDEETAARLLGAGEPELEPLPEPVFHRARSTVG